MGFASWVSWCPCPIDGIRYMAVVLIVTHLQSGGKVSVSLLAMAWYFGCQFKYPWCLSCVIKTVDISIYIV